MDRVNLSAISPNNGRRKWAGRGKVLPGGLAKSKVSRRNIVMSLSAIIDEIALQADDFLAGLTDRAHARAGIAELLTMDYADLVAADRATVTDGVMAVLEAEDFFGTAFVGNPFADDPESPAD
jgi:hypothetical protein